jgi:hypothetical protein
MKTMVILDETIVRYLLGLVEANRVPLSSDEALARVNQESEHSLLFALSVLERAKKDSEEKVKP